MFISVHGLQQDQVGVAEVSISSPFLVVHLDGILVHRHRSLRRRRILPTQTIFDKVELELANRMDAGHAMDCDRALARAPLLGCPIR